MDNHPPKFDRLRGAVAVFAVGLITFLCLVSSSALAQNQPSQSPQSHMKVCTTNKPPPCATRPHPRYTPDPPYSEEGRRARIEGTVVLETVVGEDGIPARFTSSGRWDTDSTSRQSMR